MPLRTYRIWDLTIGSEQPIPELPRAPQRSPDWLFSVGEGTAPRRPGTRWFHRWRFPDGRQWLSFARHDTGYRLRFAGIAEFEVVPADRTIACYAQPRAPLRTLRHLLLDQVLPLVAGGSARLALHASAVALPGGAVCFLGPAGRGKSTIAAAIARAGFPLLSDDCLLIDWSAARPHALPSYPGVRLQPDSLVQLFGTPATAPTVSHYSRKRRVTGQHGAIAFAGARVPLGRLYVLAEPDMMWRAGRVEIRPRPAREALMDLLALVFHLDVHDPVRVGRAFELACALVQSNEVRSLAFPWELHNISVVAEAILRDAAAVTR